ncbi:hypothetical protein Tco_0454802 [Tanacetum coccineum]
MIHILMHEPCQYYDGTHRFTLEYKNPRSLNKALNRNPKLYHAISLYDNNVHACAYDFDKTLKIVVESRLKENAIEIGPIDYTKLNNIYEHFVPQTNFSEEQLYFLNSITTVVVLVKNIFQKATEPPPEMPKKSHAKRYFASFIEDMKHLELVVQSRTELTALNFQASEAYEVKKAKSTWDDLILYHEGPSDVKESRVMDLKLNDGIKLSKLKINTGCINGLPKKWLSFFQSLRNINHVKESELAFLFGKLKYEKNLIDSIYEIEKKKSLVTATPLSTAFISTYIVQDFQDSHDDEEDTRSSQEYLNDLEECHTPPKAETRGVMEGLIIITHGVDIEKTKMHANKSVTKFSELKWILVS